MLEHAIKTNVSSNAFNVDTFLKIFKFHAGIESAIQCLMFSQKKKKKTIFIFISKLNGNKYNFNALIRRPWVE